jgi:hypothetical protein
MNLPAASCGVSKGGISILIPLTLTLSRRGERESKVTLQRATGNYQVKLIGEKIGVRVFKGQPVSLFNGSIGT